MKDLIPANGHTADIVPYDADAFTIPGMEHVTPGELRVPVLKLVQAQSKIDGAQDHLGEWHNSVTGEFLSSPELLIIGVAKGRVMFPETYSADNEPMCGSDNGRNPRADYIGKEIRTITFDEKGDPKKKLVVIGGPCADCPFGKWTEDAKGNSKPPACNEVATFAGLGQDGLPVLLQIKSTGMRAASNLKTLIATHGIRRSIVLGSTRESNDSGTYYVPAFFAGQKPDTEWQQAAVRLARLGNFAERNQQAAMEQDAKERGYTGNSGDEDVPPPSFSDEEFPF